MNDHIHPDLSKLHSAVAALEHLMLKTYGMPSEAEREIARDAVVDAAIDVIYPEPADA